VAVTVKSLVRHCTMITETNQEILRLTWRVVIPFFNNGVWFKSEKVNENLRKLHNEGLNSLYL